MKILDEFTRKATLTYARMRQPRSLLGPTLFPNKTVNELSFEYWKDLNHLPVMASVQAFGAEAEIASRDGAQKISGEIPTIKRKIPLSGRALVALRREGAGDYDFVRNQLYNDLDNMIDAVQARMEKMRIDALTTGQLQLAENGVIMTVDYGVPAEHKEILLGNSLWSAAQTATPLDNIQEWVDTVVANTGIRPARILTSNTVVANMLKCAEVRTYLGIPGGGALPTLAALNEFLRASELPTIATYDLQVRQQLADGAYQQVRYFPDNMFILLPGEALGDTLVGPTEDAMLDADVDTAEIAGVYAAVYKESMDPPVITTKAAASAIPTFPMADAVFQAQVLV